MPMMRTGKVFLVALPARARSAAVAAAHLAFPGAQVVELAAEGEVVHQELTAGPGPALLVFADPVSASVLEATQVVDKAGLPAWAVLVMGGNGSDLVECIPADEWEPPLLARIFRSALLQHGLLCENLRLRGDLKTVARRFTHDLVTPVGCINTSAAVLKILPPEEAESIATIIRNIEESSEEISVLIARVGFVITATADPKVPASVEMGEVVAGALEKLEADILKVRATVVLPPSWPEASGVADWLRVVWWNLLGNAVRHGGPGVRIQLAWQACHEGFRFSVTDNGAGVAPAIRPILFRAFSELHAGHGTGLGLSIVQRLVALQGGSCDFETPPEGGSRFSFTLPAAGS